MSGSSLDESLWDNSHNTQKKEKEEHEKERQEQKEKEKLQEKTINALMKTLKNVQSKNKKRQRDYESDEEEYKSSEEDKRRRCDSDSVEEIEEGELVNLKKHLFLRRMISLKQPRRSRRKDPEHEMIEQHYLFEDDIIDAYKQSTETWEKRFKKISKLYDTKELISEKCMDLKLIPRKENRGRTWQRMWLHFHKNGEEDMV